MKLNGPQIFLGDSLPHILQHQFDKLCGIYVLELGTSRREAAKVTLFVFSRDLVDKERPSDLLTAAGYLMGCRVCVLVRGHIQYEDASGFSQKECRPLSQRPLGCGSCEGRFRSCICAVLLTRRTEVLLPDIKHPPLDLQSFLMLN